MKPRGFVGFEILLVGLAVAAVLGYIAFLHVRLSDCRADLAQFKSAYTVLAGKVQTQNDAVLALEKKSAETARKAALARAQAGKATEVAQRHADALAGFLGAPRAPSECPSADAIKVVRDDLRSQQTP